MEGQPGRVSLSVMATTRIPSTTATELISRVTTSRSNHHDYPVLEASSTTLSTTSRTTEAEFHESTATTTLVTTTTHKTTRAIPPLRPLRGIAYRALPCTDP